jgi:hypothetical protein
MSSFLFSSKREQTEETSEFHFICVSVYVSFVNVYNVRVQWHDLHTEFRKNSQHLERIQVSTLPVTAR